MAVGLTTSGSNANRRAEEDRAATWRLTLPFTPVQPELLGMPNSFSNAWGDFDNDGDLDLAVSLGSGEVRLYRNDNGRARQRRRARWACHRPAATSSAA